MRTKIRFDPDAHKYYIFDREIPSVTTVLKKIGVLDDRWFKAGSGEKGTKVHEFLELIDQGFKVTVPITIRGYVRAYKAFREANPGFVLKSLEEVIFDRSLHVCGKVDRVFTDTETDETWVVDIKTGTPQRFHRIQVSAYANALKEKRMPRIAGLYLSPDGNYKFKEYQKSHVLWRSCVAVYDFLVRR